MPVLLEVLLQMLHGMSPVAHYRCHYKVPPPPAHRHTQRHCAQGATDVVGRAAALLTFERRSFDTPTVGWSKWNTAQ